MTLKVVGAGFGRTGTESMRFALNKLGFGPCHHMHEVLNNPEQLERWGAVAHGATPDWEVLFEGYRSAVDWPSAYFWRELANAYPDARVLLTTRSADSWLASFEKTILASMVRRGDPDTIGARLIAKGTFDNRLDDLAYIKTVFERHVQEVKDTIPADRLLVYHIGDGWEPLCEFLQVPVPDEPFPRSNSSDEFNARKARSS